MIEEPTMVGGAAAGVEAGQGEVPGRRGAMVYFITHHDYCDHLVFFDNGTFANGSCFARGGFHEGGRGGHWRLAEQGTENDTQMTLVLQWHTAVEGCEETLPAVDDDMRCFAARGVTINHIAGATLHTTSAVPERSASMPVENSHSSAQLLPLPQSPSSVSTPVSPMRGLLFSSVGTQCMPVVQGWLESSTIRDFDVALVFYGDPNSLILAALRELTSAQQGVEVLENKGMKWPNFRHWLELHGGAEAVAARYDYIWIVDDDVRLPTSGVSRMFEILRQHSEISFACPSFDAGSDGVWRSFDGHDPRWKLRYTNFVECTAPVLKSSMLLDPLFQPCLRAVRTGCFIDFCFHPAAGGRVDAVAIIDAVQCHHPPRTPDAPSEMRRVQAWHDHKKDDIFFEREGVPREWWAIEPRFFQPRVLGAIPADVS
eukprot:CAMPEP_0172685452 /NCGR_PEP_ID=MMETSP1074-20121228/20244_1 /TAXON_ID=2916 /ORGANISM="Ceratium fusus, Strain PA161109" /LENGTH=427 /DNA_ID=CAMNT_0013504605 /DNA_START=352 /DNA_END=1635 /DNA_ORIENTATION=-